MFKVVIYEDGDTYGYYEEETKNAIYLDIENYQDLTKIVEIVLKSGHSIEICKINIDEEEN